VECDITDAFNVIQESRAVARKSRDVVCYLFRYLKHQRRGVYSTSPKTFMISISSQLLHSRRNPAFTYPNRIIPEILEWNRKFGKEIAWCRVLSFSISKTSAAWRVLYTSPKTFM